MKTITKHLIASVTIVIISAFVVNFCHSSSSLALSNPIAEHQFKRVGFQYNDSVSGTKTKCFFEYNDGLFLLDANQLNGDIAKMSIGLASAAYSVSNIKAVLGNGMGFTCDIDKYSQTYDYVSSMRYGSDDVDRVAYSIWHKEIGNKIVYCVPIKGTSQNAEWYSNFNLGLGDEHQGFRIAADKVMYDILAEINSDNYDNSHTIILTNGHSRGAAVSNIVAADLSLGDYGIPVNQIFSYNFATPAVSKNANKSLKNIFNYNNPGDLIPLLPLEKWGFKRNGIDIDVYPTAAYKQNTYLQFKHITGKDCLSEDKPDSYLNLIHPLLASPEVFMSEHYQFIFRLVAFYMGDGTTRKEWDAVIRGSDYQAALDYGLIIKDAAGNYVNALSKTPTSPKDLRENLCAANIELYQNLIQFIGDHKDEVITMNQAQFKSFLSKYSTTIKKIEKYTGLLISSPSDLNDRKMELSDLLERTRGFINSSKDIFHLFFGENGLKIQDAVAHAHDQAFYIACANSLYFGDHGWAENSADLYMNSDIIQSNSLSILSIGDGCFANSPNLHNIVLNNDLARIGDHAFENCINAIGTLDLPDGLTEIGDSAFYGCSGLVGEVKIPNGITKIENYVFYKCSGLSKVIIPESVKSIAYASFIDCSGITELTLPGNIDHVFYYDNDMNVYYPFKGCTGISVINIIGKGEMPNYYTDAAYYRLTNYYLYTPWHESKVDNLTVNIAEGITRIGDYTFKSCKNLSNVSIPSTVTSIGPYAYSSCVGIKGELKLPSALKSIGMGAFQYCSGISGELVIPQGMTSIPFNCFESCTNISSVMIPDSVKSIANYSFEYCKSITDISIAEGIAKIGRTLDIGSAAFSNCSSLSTISIPLSTKYISRDAFNNCNELSDLYYGGTKRDWLRASNYNDVNLNDANIHYHSPFDDTIGLCGESIIWTWDGQGTITLIGSGSMYRDYSFDEIPWKNYRSKIQSVVFQSSSSSNEKPNITCIGQYSFDGCNNLKTITLPESVTAIYEYAFCGCESLTGISFPNGLTSIDLNSFKGCKGLKNVTIPNSVTYLSGFSECTGLTSISIPKSVTSIGTDAFEGCTNLQSVSIPDSVTSLGWDSFKNCTGLKIVEIPNSVIKIGRGAFYNCKGLTSVIIPNSVTSIGEEAFYGCESILKLTISNKITSISEDCFRGCKSLENICIPDGIREIGNWAFYGCTKLTKIKISNGVTKIGDYAFGGCDSIEEISIPNSVTYLSGFPGCSNLTSVTIPDSVTTIGTRAFNGCTNLLCIFIPNSVNSIGQYAFAGCSNLQDVYFTGTEEKWNNISISSYNDPLLQSNIHFDYVIRYSIKLNTVINGYASLSLTEAKEGEEVTIDTTPNEGFELDTITVNGVAIKDYKFKMPAENVTVEVSFKKTEYSITITEPVNGSVSVSNEIANFGDEIDITVNPDLCYELASIKVNGETIEGLTFTMPAKNVTVEVTFLANHNLSLVDSKPATCTENGHEAYYECKNCHKLFSDAEGTKEITEPKVIKALGHSWDEGTTTKEPTCEEAGSKLFKCTRDGCTESKTEELAALGHHLVLVKEKAPTKTEPGNILYYKCDREGCGKLFSDAEGKHEISLSDTVIPVMIHELTMIKAKDATCIESGNTTYYVCKDADCGCGKVYSDKYGQHEIKLEDTVIPAKGHSIKTVDEKKATCTEDGYASHFECSTCHKKFSDSEGKTEINSLEVYPKLGHSWDEGEVTTQPGCETEGVKTFHCTREGCKSTKEEPIPALGHDKEHLKHVKAKGETYDEDGNIEYYICERCGKKFADPDCKSVLSDAEIVIPKKGAPELGDLVEIGNFKYQVTNPSTDGTGTLTFKGVITRVASVSVPATVTIKESSYIVNRIGTKAFYGDKTLKTVYIGNNVVIIDSYAFYGCSNLVKVSGGKALKTIGTKAFAHCSKLKSFSITSSVLNKIGSYAFQKDKKLKTIYIRYTTKLTKSGVKKSLKSSSVKTVKVKKSKVKKYKKYFTKKNAGRKVKVKK